MFLTLDLIGVQLPDVGVSPELLLRERESLRVVGVVWARDVVRHDPLGALLGGAELPGEEIAGPGVVESSAAALAVLGGGVALL